MKSGELIGDARREFWRMHIREWVDSGCSQTEFCRRENLPRANFHYWKKKFRETKAKGQLRLVPLEMVAEAADNDMGKGVHVECSGCRIEVKAGFNPGVLTDVIKILRSL